MPPKTRKKGADRSPNLPSLFPTHDGSYGINTLINTEAEPKKGQKPKPGIAKEQIDDNKWARAMKGKAGKKYGMNSDLQKAIAESQNLVEQEEHQGQNSSNQKAPDSPDQKAPDTPEDAPSSSSNSSQSSPPIPEQSPHVPNYNPSLQPFSEEHDDRPRPPYKRAELSSADPHEFFGVSQPISPPSEHVPFYGIPQGDGSRRPISPTRPDTARSFNLENDLFADATLRSPGQFPGPLGVTSRPQGLWRIPTPAPSNSNPSSTSTSGQSFPRQPHVSASQSKLAPNQLTTCWQPSPPTSSSSSLEKDSTRTQGQPSNSPKTGVRQATGPSLARNGRGANRKKGWSWPSASLIIPPILLFLALALGVWFVLSSIPVDSLNGNDAGAPNLSATHPFSGFGTVWQKISGLLPGISDLDGYISHNIPEPLKSVEVDSDGLMADLRQRTPESVWVRRDKNGKIKIPEDFWHALKNLIEQDDNILTLKHSDISEGHWRAIKARVKAAGLGAGASTKSIEGLVDKKISQSWDTWLKQNEQLLKKDKTGIALTKDDFMKLYQQESVSYQREIRQELTELRERISRITEQMAKLPDKTTSNASMDKAEITKIVNSLVSKAINSATLDAVARGFIKGNVNDVLANQVNCFTIGAGVAIDPDTSSPGWKPPKNPYMSKKWLDMDGYKVQPPMAALSPWDQEGECFCAGPDRRGYGKGTNNITIITSRDIIPQHLVVEHILPGATLDPGAMPKEIEVWGYIEELDLRRALEAFSERQFPNTPKEEVLSEGFVKIGHFTYENKATGNGVQVFKINNEVATLRAVTNRIVVRAINNYGADHTCFYRLRLYGEIIERPDDPPTSVEEENKKKFWFF
ncbi:hypothetical protein F5Y09DRAFT_36429 [Xylaria sp. FL1042]|nr:hypothetical protein F5Y09DRAFT_36429 [Xylaria sp. FL1042]